MGAASGAANQGRRGPLLSLLASFACGPAAGSADVPGDASAAHWEEALSGQREGCYIRGICRAAGRLDEGPWRSDLTADRYGSGGFPAEAERCLARAPQLWAACGNTELEAVTSVFTPTGASTQYPEVRPEAEEQWGQLESFAHYKMSYAWKPSVNQFTDADAAPPFRDCDFDNGVDWPGLRAEMHEALGLDGGAAQEVRRTWRREPVRLERSCEERLATLQRKHLGDYAKQTVGAWAISDATSDCFLGMLALRLYELACSHMLELERQEGGFGHEEHFQRQDRALVGLEGLFFHLQEGGDPAGGAFEALVLTTWPLVELLEALASMWRQTFRRLMPSLCDRRDDAERDQALRRSLSRRFDLDGDRGASDEEDWRLLAAEPRPPWAEAPSCAWRHVSVLLATAAEVAGRAPLQPGEELPAAAARALRSAESWLRGWEVAAEPLNVPFLEGAPHQLPRAPRPQFFYDLLVSEWPVLPLLRRVRHELRLLAGGDSDGAGGAAASAGPAAQGRWRASLFLCRGSECAERRAVGVLGRPPGVLFLGGGANTPQWAAFSLRGRQVARALRVHTGCDAQVWQHNCEGFCNYLNGQIVVRNNLHTEGDTQAVEGSLPARLLVHVKFVCPCAMRLMPGAKHILDVVDNSQWVNDALRRAEAEAEGTHSESDKWLSEDGEEQPELDIDAVIVESRQGAARLAALPFLERRGAPVFSIPHMTSLAHASAAPRSEEQVLRPVRLVALHTTHWDPVYDRVRQFLRERHPEVRFVHWTPRRLLGGSQGELAGRMISPAQLRRVQSQLAEADLTFVKQSGCLSEPAFCRLFKPGQRLLHAWAAGVPAVVVLGNSSPFRDYLDDEEASIAVTPPGVAGDGASGGGEPASAAEQAYPPEAMVASDGCEGSAWHQRPDGEGEYAEVFCDGDTAPLFAALDAAIRSPELRARLRREGLRRAERWSSRRLAEAYATAFFETLRA